MLINSLLESGYYSSEEEVIAEALKALVKEKMREEAKKRVESDYKTYSQQLELDSNLDDEEDDWF